jgi:hypothetical protein
VTLKLIAHPSVVCTPHLGASTEEAQKKVAKEIAEQMSDAFKGTGFVGVVNAPYVALSHKPAFAPYVRLAAALGELLGQVIFSSAEGSGPASGSIKGTSVRIEVEGPELQEKGFSELARAVVLKGLLPAVPRCELEPDAVNFINAPHLAKEHGLLVSVKSSAGGSAASAGPFANSIRVVVSSPSGGERVATGAVIEGQPRIVQIDHWQNFPTFVPQGHLLLFNNTDKPGTVASVTSVLSGFNVNIASLAVARQFGGGGSPALTIMVCDQKLPSAAVKKLAAIPGIFGVSVASFSEAA